MGIPRKEYIEGRFSIFGRDHEPIAAEERWNFPSEDHKKVALVPC